MGWLPLVRLLWLPQYFKTHHKRRYKKLAYPVNAHDRYM